MSFRKSDAFRNACKLSKIDKYMWCQPVHYKNSLPHPPNPVHPYSSSLPNSFLTPAALCFHSWSFQSTLSKTAAKLTWLTPCFTLCRHRCGCGCGSGSRFAMIATGKTSQLLAPASSSSSFLLLLISSVETFLERSFSSTSIICVLLSAVIGRELLKQYIFTIKPRNKHNYFTLPTHKHNSFSNPQRVINTSFRGKYYSYLHYW